MYAVISLLRRLAAAVVLVGEHMTVEQQGHWVVPLHRAAESLDIQGRARTSARRVAPMYELRVDARTSSEAAMGIVKVENHLMKCIGDDLFTLLLGEEEEEATPDGIRRLVRIGVVFGVYTIPTGAPSGAELRAAPPRARVGGRCTVREF